MFGKKPTNKDLKGKFDSINELNEEEEIDDQTKDNLVDAYNNPLAINMGLGPLPLTTSVYKDEDNNNSLKK